jgi:reductive dehalogenase
VFSHWYDGHSSPPKNSRIVFSDEPGFESFSSPTQLEDGTQIIPKEIKYAIVVAHEEDYPSLKTAPSAASYAGILNFGYQKVVHIVAPIAEFIRGIGFHAIPTVGDTCLKVPMAIDAGLGEDARNGMVISPEYGPRIRIGAILTDLPLSTDHPITFGVHEFCSECKKCAQACPGQAISFGDRTNGENPNDVDAPTTSGNPGALRWIRNQDRCVTYRLTVGGFCGICRRVCPWNLPTGNIFTLIKKLAIKQGINGRRVMREFFETGEFGKRTSTYEWWTKLQGFSEIGEHSKLNI